MEDSKNYTGKVVKVYSDYGNGPVEYTGIVYLQLPNPWGQTPRLSLLLTNGTTFDPPARNIQRITSTRLPEDLRKALTAGCKALQNQMAFEREYKEKQCIIREAVGKAMQAVKDLSTELSSREFMSAVEDLFRSCYPGSGSYYQRYFTCTSLSSNEVTMAHVQDVEKYVSPKGYSFIAEEYDRSLYIKASDPTLASFCDQKAPAVLAELKKYDKGTGAAIGDKNWLTVHRSYTFPLKYGLSKQSLEQIRTEVLGLTPRTASKSSLDEKIKTAQTQNGASGKTNVKENGHDR